MGRLMEAKSMNQSQWLASTNPHEMLAFLKEKKPSGWSCVLSWMGLRKGEVSARKCLLFACACCRRIWPLLADERTRQAVEVAELYADGLANKRALHQAVLAARAASAESDRPRVMVGEWLAAAQARAAEAVACTLEADDPADEAATWGKEAIRAWAAQYAGGRLFRAGQGPRLPHHVATPEAAWIAEAIAQCDLLRDLIGNPFQEPQFNPSWRTTEAVTLATSIVKDRAFTGLPELANLLDKAGCNNTELLKHCRETKEHARGCWAVDLVLGKK
jgi:hypothetical protein